MKLKMGEKKSIPNVDFEEITAASLVASLDQFNALVSKLNDRRNFTSVGRSGAQERNGNQDDNQLAVQTALHLLQNLPPVRAPALAFLAQALSKQVFQYMQRKGNTAGTKENSLEYQIETLLSELVENSPDTWGPLVARWAIDQLGKWSGEWEGVVLGRADTTLEERVASWLQCNPVQSLANLTVSCVALDPDNAVAALLETSLHSGPPLDWLVAHVGCSFPSTIVNRVLTLGLKSFSSSMSMTQANQQLLSVVNILDHLAERHFPDIKRALQAIVLKSFSNNDTHNKSAIPYVLHLAANKRSRFVLKALTASIPYITQHASDVSLIGQQFSWWIPSYFPNMTTLVKLIVHLLLEAEGYETTAMVCSLLQASSSSDVNINKISNEIIEHLLSELCSATYMKQASLPYTPHIPLISGLGLLTQDSFMLDQEPSKETMLGLITWAVTQQKEAIVKRGGQLISFVAMQQGQEAAIWLLKKIFVYKLPVNNHLLYLMDTLATAIVNQQSSETSVTTIISKVIGDNLDHSRSSQDILATVEKLKYIMITNRFVDSYLKYTFSLSITSVISKLGRVINVPDIGYFVLELLGQFNFERPMNLSDVFTLAHAIVYYFFNTLKSLRSEEKLLSSNMCNKRLTQLSHPTVGHSFLVRLVFEASFRDDCAYCMGSRKEIKFESKEPKDALLQSNLQFDSWVKLPRSHNTIFHVGRIGTEPHRKKLKPAPLLDPEIVALNTQLVLNALSACSRTQGTSRGSATVALLLVEYVSPDIMFNGFPWPEENIKFTFERDLIIKKTFDDFPIAWHFLELVARNRPALCYCSVLVRALTAAYIAFWNTFCGNVPSQNSKMLSSTRRLLEIMVIGQFLPEIFSVLPQMVDHLAAHEIVCVLQDVWQYLRSNTPSPDRWVLLPSGVHDRHHEVPAPRYTDRCLKLILMHIEKLGHLLPYIMQHRPQTDTN